MRKRVIFASQVICASRVVPQGVAVAELGSHSPLGDRQARLSGEERANHGAKRSSPSAKHIFLYIFLNLCYNSLNK